MAGTYISTLELHWKAPVANSASLPLIGNENGDARVTLDTGDIYTWDGAAWNVVGGGGGGMSIGGTVTSGTQYNILFINPAGVLAQDSDFQFDGDLRLTGNGNIVLSPGSSPPQTSVDASIFTTLGGTSSGIIVHQTVTEESYGFGNSSGQVWLRKTSGGDNTFYARVANISAWNGTENLTDFATAKLQFGTAAAPSYTFIGDTDTGAYRSAANEYSIATAGSERARITSGGNVGVNTTTPASTESLSTSARVLEVAGQTDATVNSYGMLEMRNPSTEAALPGSSIFGRIVAASSAKAQGEIQFKQGYDFRTGVDLWAQTAQNVTPSQVARFNFGAFGATFDLIGGATAVLTYNGGAYLRVGGISTNYANNFTVGGTSGDGDTKHFGSDGANIYAYKNLFVGTGGIALGYASGDAHITPAAGVSMKSGTDLTLQALGANSVILRTNGATAVTVDSSQNITVNAGNISISTAGKGLNVKEGTNARQGLSTLVAGTVVVSTTAVTANSRILLTHQNNSGTPGFPSVTARTAATSFTITSASVLDTSDIAWEIFEPA